MLIIFGFRVRFRDVSHHTFFCPGCGGDREGLLQEARRWFALFFIPIIPMNVIGQQVRCTTCNRTYRPEVLDHPTTNALQTILANALRAVAVLMVAAGDRTDPRLREQAVSVVRQGVPDYDDATLESDLGHLHPAQAPAYVAPLADGLELAGREQLLADLVRVAQPSGGCNPEQRDLIGSVGQALGLTPAHVAGIVTTVEARQP